MDAINSIFKSVGDWIPKKEIETVVLKEIKEVSSMNSLAGRHFIRIAGLSGGIAVGMAAYGAHAFKADEENEKAKTIFDSGNKLHLIHSVALLGVPLTRRPNLIGGVMTAGMVIFCGTCYYNALTGDTRVRKATPYGGILLMLSWFLMAL